MTFIVCLIQLFLRSYDTVTIQSDTSTVTANDVLFGVLGIFCLGIVILLCYVISKWIVQKVENFHKKMRKTSMNKERKQYLKECLFGEIFVIIIGIFSLLFEGSKYLGWENNESKYQRLEDLLFYVIVIAIFLLFISLQCFLFARERNKEKDDATMYPKRISLNKKKKKLDLKK